MSDREQAIECHVFTTARRHPKVIGVIGGHVMPWTSTNTQLVVAMGTAVFLLKFRTLWGALLPLPVQLAVVALAPCLGWWLVRYWHPEGREPLRAAMGVSNYVLRPRSGSCNGRPVRGQGRGTVVRGNYVCSEARR